MRCWYGPPRRGTLRARARCRRPARAGAPRTECNRWWSPSRASSPSSVARPAVGPSSIADRDRAVQRDHRVVGGPLEQVVERHDLGPVGVLVPAGLIMHGRDRGLDLVLAELVPGASASVTSATPSAMSARSHCERSCSASGTSSPCSSVAGRAARVGQQHECEQARDLGVVGQVRVEHASEPDRLAREVGPRELGAAARHVALVEQHVEHVEHEPSRSAARRSAAARTTRPPLRSSPWPG